MDLYVSVFDAKKKAVVVKQWIYKLLYDYNIM